MDIPTSITARLEELRTCLSDLDIQRSRWLDEASTLEWAIKQFEADAAIDIEKIPDVVLSEVRLVERPVGKIKRAMAAAPRVLKTKGTKKGHIRPLVLNHLKTQRHAATRQQIASATGLKLGQVDNALATLKRAGKASHALEYGYWTAV